MSLSLISPSIQHPCLYFVLRSKLTYSQAIRGLVNLQTIQLMDWTIQTNQYAKCLTENWD